MDMNCYRTSNNKFFNAPPRMADGRHFTDYRPSCDANSSVRNNQQITSNHNFRMFLTHNAEKLMELHNKHNYAKNGVFQCKAPYEVGTMLPEIDRISCNESTCNVVGNNPDGLGRGRQYSNEPNPILDPFKCPSYTLEDNKCTPTEDNLNYYPIDKHEAQRQAVIGGGNVLGGGDPNVYN